MQPLLRVEGLRIEAGAAGHPVPLVEELSFSIAPGEVLGIVGESGSGKSMSAYAIAGLLPDGVRVAAGRLELEGQSLEGLTATARRKLAGDRIGMVFQDPLSSFNPVRTIGSILQESAVRHRRLSAREARERVVAALADVRLPRPEALFDAYPHQLSGGQRQRAMIALALLNDPALLIADEPTTALDATVQLQVLALLERGAAGRATLLITHDLGVAAGLCDRILVMQAGRCMEHGPTGRLLDAPNHPYTRQLLAAATSLDRPAPGAAPP
jgi:ABC-type glutathione transport system ATPase component